MSADELNEEPTREDLVAMLNDVEYLAENGYRMTPKGFMGLVLMEHGVPVELASQLSAEMEDRIFRGGFTYIHEDNLDFGDVNDEEV